MTGTYSPRGIAALMAAAAILSGTSIATCGTAAANNPVEQLLEDIARLAARSIHGSPDMHVPVPNGIPLDPGPNRAVMGALGPAARGAADNADEFLMIKQVACRINSAVNAGQKINDAYLDSHYTEAEQAAILDEYHSLKALQDTEDGVELVKIICSFRS